MGNLPKRINGVPTNINVNTFGYIDKEKVKNKKNERAIHIHRDR